MEPALTLVNAPLDLQVTICIFLHPSDILALRKTCKALEYATRQRIVWVAVLHRVCIDNSLFLPSFPVPDMSDLDLERAAMGPRRWIELCGTLQKEDPTFSEMLHLRTAKVIEDVGKKSEFFIVPGGRYLVTADKDLSVWDLGYVSTVDLKLVASVGQGKYVGFLMVQATPDGKGLVILSSNHCDFESYRFSIFEIFPQSEKPLLTQIACYSSKEYYPVHLLPDTLICRVFRETRIAFKVVNYRTNYSRCFTADVSLINNDVETFATKTAIIVFCRQGVLIWAMPPLSPQPSDVSDHFRDENLTPIPPLLKIPYPDGISLIPRNIHKGFNWMTVSSWYFGSFGEAVYFDMINSQIQRFKIIIKPDLSDASLFVINMPEVISDDFLRSIETFRIQERYRICEDALVYFWSNRKTWGAYNGLKSAPFTKVVTRWDGTVESLCPTSGRVVCRTEFNDGKRKKSRTVVVGLF